MLKIMRYNQKTRGDVMINELQVIFIGMALVFVIWTICLGHLYKKEQLRANILQEQLTIRREIERGNRPDKILWDYHDVTYLNNSYNVKFRNAKTQHKSLKGDVK